MITFNMTTEENFASFTDPDNGTKVFVDSFDNRMFDVRVGSVVKSQSVGTVTATDSKTLNSKLTELYQSYQEVIVNN